MNSLIHLEDKPMFDDIIKNVQMLGIDTKTFVFQKVGISKSDQIYQIHILNIKKIHLSQIEHLIEKVGKYILNVQIHVLDSYYETKLANMKKGIESDSDEDENLPVPLSRVCLSLECCSTNLQTNKYRNILVQANRKIKIDHATLKKLSKETIDKVVQLVPDESKDPYLNNMKSTSLHPSMITSNNNNNNTSTTNEIHPRRNSMFEMIPGFKTSYNYFKNRISSSNSNNNNNNTGNRMEDDGEETSDGDSIPDTWNGFTLVPAIANRVMYSKEERKIQKTRQTYQDIMALQKIQQAQQQQQQEQQLDFDLNVESSPTKLTKTPPPTVMKITTTGKAPIVEMSALYGSLVNIDRHQMIPITSPIQMPINDRIIMINMQQDIRKLQGHHTPADLDIVCQKYPNTSADYLMVCRHFRIVQLDDLRILLSIFKHNINDMWIDFQENNLYIHWVGETNQLEFVWRSVGLDKISKDVLTSSENTTIPVNLRDTEPVYGTSSTTITNTKRKHKQSQQTNKKTKIAPNDVSCDF